MLALLLKLLVPYVIVIITEIHSTQTNILLCVGAYCVFHLMTLTYEYNSRSFVEDMKKHQGILLFYFLLCFFFMFWPLLIIKVFGPELINALTFYSRRF